MSGSWDLWVNEALSKLQSLKLLQSLRPIHLALHESNPLDQDFPQYYDGLRQWDRDSVEVDISEPTFQKWLHDIPSSGDDIMDSNGDVNGTVSSDAKFRKLLIFSGNDYLGLSSHPMVIKAAIKAAEEHGMGPRGSAVIFGYTNYHRLLESSLAELKKKEDCLVCPTGFSANMAFLTALGSIAVLLAEGGKPTKEEKVAIFSDSLYHASIIDGVRLAEKQGGAVTFVYKHCDMSHLDALLSNCTMEKKVVVTDSLFSMDGDFAPMADLVQLRKKHDFLLVIDDAHASFVYGKNGGGAAEKFCCEDSIDICLGTLSKGAGCIGGFIACSKKWKVLIQSRGRSFMFSTSSPVPIAAAAHAVNVAKNEIWRRKAIWSRVLEFRALTGIPITSAIISLVVGSEEKALEVSRHLLVSGYHVTAIRPPMVPPNSCRLRIVLSAAHTEDDLRKLVAALSECISFQDVRFSS